MGEKRILVSLRLRANCPAKEPGREAERTVGSAPADAPWGAPGQIRWPAGFWPERQIPSVDGMDTNPGSRIPNTPRLRLARPVTAGLTVAVAAAAMAAPAAAVALAAAPTQPRHDQHRQLQPPRPARVGHAAAHAAEPRRGHGPAQGRRLRPRD